MAHHPDHLRQRLVFWWDENGVRPRGPGRPEGKGSLRVKVADMNVSVEVTPTKRWRRDYLEYDLGEIQLQGNQAFKVGISTEGEGGTPVYVNVLELIPVDSPIAGRSFEKTRRHHQTRRRRYP